MPVPILYHIFKRPLPYLPTLALQEFIHAFQLRLSGRLSASPAEVDISPDLTTYPDVLLLLEHRPVYTAGRRQTEDALRDEKTRLEKYGAIWVATQRGGETTYHGPGQIVGYPLFDLERMGVRVSALLTAYTAHLQEILLIPSVDKDKTACLQCSKALRGFPRETTRHFFAYVRTYRRLSLTY